MPYLMAWRLNHDVIEYFLGMPRGPGGIHEHWGIPVIYTTTVDCNVKGLKYYTARNVESFTL